MYQRESHLLVVGFLLAMQREQLDVCRAEGREGGRGVRVAEV